MASRILSSLAFRLHLPGSASETVVGRAARDAVWVEKLSIQKETHIDFHSKQRQLAGFKLDRPC